MRILMVIPRDYEKYHFIPLGIAYIASVLKKNGFKIYLLDMRKKHHGSLEKYDPFFYKEKHEIFDEKTLIQKLNAVNPSLVMITAISTFVKSDVFKIAETVKKHSSALVVVGGTAVTAEPENFIDNNFVDMVCIGEGEFAALELCQKLKMNKDITKIKNLWIKKTGKIIKNKVRPLIQDLDNLPFPDWDIFTQESDVIGKDIMAILVSRGCPYACTYCINNYLIKLYKNKGRFNRYRSVENVIEEIKLLKNKFKPKIIHFHDESFTLRKDWVSNFCKAYKESGLDIPFSIDTNILGLDEKIISELKEAGLVRVTIALESGNEKLRTHMLHRPYYSNHMIREVIKILKKHRIHVKLNSIIGIPEEKKEDALETILINLETNPDYHNYAIFVPFSSTELGEYALKRGFVIDCLENKTKLFEHTTLSMPKFTKSEIDTVYETANKTRKLLRNKFYRFFLTNKFGFVRKMSLHFVYYLTKIERKSTF